MTVAMLLSSPSVKLTTELTVAPVRMGAGKERNVTSALTLCEDDNVMLAPSTSVKLETELTNAPVQIAVDKGRNFGFRSDVWIKLEQYPCKGHRCKSHIVHDVLNAHLDNVSQRTLGQHVSTHTLTMRHNANFDNTSRCTLGRCHRHVETGRASSYIQRILGCGYKRQSMTLEVMM